MFKDPSRLAWTVLIVAFIIFCISSSALFLGVRWFLFDSTVSLTSTLSVSRNTVSVRTSASDTAYQAVRSSTYLSRDARMTTDSASQGYVTFRDPFTQDVVASITLFRDSSLTLTEAVRPRFEFSSRPYIITIEAEGSFDVDIIPELARSITLVVQSNHGEILLGDSGRYMLTNRDDEFTVHNRTGIAVVINNAREARSIPPAMQGRIDGLTNEITSGQPFTDILPDGSFNEFNPVNETLSTQWGCYHFEDDPNAAIGEARREIVNGYSVMHIVRVGAAGKDARNHAQNGCLQFLNTESEPLPIEVFDYLELRISMQIRNRPDMLNTCGQAGSECPVMVVIEYPNPYDPSQRMRWIHGFYTKYDQAVGWPLRCDSCGQDHEKLNQDTWYTFTSGNLLQLLPVDQRPNAIYSVEFYASGHEYDVLLGEVALLAGNSTAAVPVVEETASQ
jgi:hypothetical protein